MKLKILHILSSNFFAGSAAYAIDLAEKQTLEGHMVYMLTDMGGLSDKFFCIQLPVSNRSIVQRIKNIRYIRKFIRTHQIDIIHAHSRAASWVAYYAVLGTKTALVSTIHGRQVKHSALRRSDVFGERVIAICPNLIEHLKTEMKFDPNKLVYIPNGFDMETICGFKRTRKDSAVVISVIGRFNGPKGAHIAFLVAQVFPYLLQAYPSLSVNLVGGEWESFPAEGEDAFNELKTLVGERIRYLGFSKNVHQLIIDSDIIVGAGRVAIEGLLHRVPVFAIGEACWHGFLAPTNIDHAISTNFGDILPSGLSFQFNANDILKEFQAFLENPGFIRADLRNEMLFCDFKQVFPKIMQVYRAALIKKMHRDAIPVLMYHKIPDNPIESQHRIFVVKQNFEKHLRFFKYRGLTSITFKDYYEFANGARPIREFPQKPFILTFDDGYEDNYTNMLPLAQKYDFKGVLFLLGDFSITKNYWDKGEGKDAELLMSPEQKKKFVDLGWEIGAHTLSHPDLTVLPQNQALNEIEMGKMLLEKELQTKIISFAYPYGFYNEQVKSLVEKSGFEFGVSTDHGGMSIEDDRFAIFRVNMFPEENLFQLYKKTSPWYRAYYRRKRGK